MSEPLHPSVAWAISCSSLSWRQWLTSCRKCSSIAVLDFSFGKATCTRLEKRRSNAASTFSGIFVAPRRMTSSEKFRLEILLKHQSTLDNLREVRKKAHYWMRSSVKSLFEAWSPLSLVPPSDSISSIKTMQGLFSFATANRHRTSSSDSPCHLDRSDDGDTAKSETLTSFDELDVPRTCRAWPTCTFACICIGLQVIQLNVWMGPIMHWPAIAWASSVFPVPGGPYSSTAAAGDRMRDLNSCGNSSGNMTYQEQVIKPKQQTNETIMLHLLVENLLRFLVANDWIIR